MRKKLFSSFIVFALVLSLTFGSTSKVSATGGFGEIILGSVGVIAVEEAIAWTLLACGLTAGADAVYRNQAELKAWTSNRLEDIKEFGNNAIEFGSDVVAGLDDWFTDVANGVMDTGSKCWDMIKGWAGTVYGSLASVPDNVFPGGETSAPVGPHAGPLRMQFESDGFQYAYYFTGVSDVTMAVVDGIVHLYSTAPFWYSSQVTHPDGNVVVVPVRESVSKYVGYYNGAHIYVQFTNAMGGVGNSGIQDFGPRTVQEYWDMVSSGVIGATPDITTVGGLNDALDKGGMSMDDYDVATKSGVVGGVINLDWQQLMDKDKIDVDSNTGVATGSIAGSLSNVATGTMPWVDSLDKVGVVPIIGDNVIDDSGVTDKPRPSKPNNPDMDGNYIFDLRNIFPFCLPFDLVDFLACLSAPPETPKFTIEIPSFDSDMSVKWHKLELDFSQFNQVAVWVRNMELFAFIVGLAMITRSKMIRG